MRRMKSCRGRTEERYVACVSVKVKRSACIANHRQTHMSDLLHDLRRRHADLAALCDALRDVLCGVDCVVNNALEEADLGRLG